MVVVGLGGGAARALELAVADPVRVAGVVLAYAHVPRLSARGLATTSSKSDAWTRAEG